MRVKFQVSIDLIMSPDRKRGRMEEQEALNQSVCQIVNEFESLENPSNKQTGQLICEFLKKETEIRSKIFTLENRVDDIEISTEKNSDELETFRTHTENQFCQMETTLHKLEQDKVDNDIFLSGFPNKPNVDGIAMALAERFKIPEQSIVKKYQYELKVKQTRGAGGQETVEQPKIIHNVVIGFKDNATKVQFMKDKKENGPILYEQLNKNCRQKNDAKTTIKCSNRLTKFNLKAQHLLWQAKTKGKISHFQLHNGTFRMKKTENSGWVNISTEMELVKLA